MDTLDDITSALVATFDPDRPPAPYPDRDLQDDLDELGGTGDAPNSPREAAALGLRMVQEETWVGVGYCLRTIRSLFGVGALYGNAETAWEEAERKHRTDDPADLKAWTPIWWTNGGNGHVALDLKRDGLCLTTDYVQSGRLGVARISALGPWCGGQLRGWTEDINGVRVWAPRVWAPRDPFGRDDKVRIVRNALQRARDNDRPTRYINGLSDWLHYIEGK